MKYKCEKCNKFFNSGMQFGGHKSSHSGHIGMRTNSTLTNNYCKNCNIKFESKCKRVFCSLKCNGNFISKSSKKRRDSSILYGRTLSFIEKYKNSIVKCEICEKPKEQEMKIARKSFAIDHDNKTGIFRGILCCACNSKLDWFINNDDNIRKYINREAPE